MRNSPINRLRGLRVSRDGSHRTVSKSKIMVSEACPLRTGDVRTPDTFHWSVTCLYIYLSFNMIIRKSSTDCGKGGYDCRTIIFLFVSTLFFKP